MLPGLAVALVMLPGLTAMLTSILSSSTAADVLPLKFASPAYTAVMALAPAFRLSAAGASVACPEASSAAVPIDAPLSINVTLPVGVPLVAEITIAVSAAGVLLDPAVPLALAVVAVPAGVIFRANGGLAAAG